MITFEIYEDMERIKEYQAEWDRMFAADAYEASLSLAWAQALIKSHLNGDAFSLVVLRDSTEILGLVPIVIRRIKKRGVSLLTVFPLSEYFNTHSDLLLKKPTKELLEVLFKALFSLKYQWDVFRINRFVETNPVLGLIEYNLKNNFPCKYDIRRSEPSYFIEFGGSYEDYLNGKSANFRHKLKSVSKKMRSLGEVAFLGHQDFHDFAKLYSIILSIEEKSWKHKHGTAITSTEKQRTFYKELFKSAFDKGWLRLGLLYLDREPIAFEVGLVKDKKYYGVHGSYNETFKKDNPGTLLLAQFIKDLIRDGIEEYDWFGEPFEWESRWTDKFRWHKSLLIYNSTPKARLFYFINSLKNKLRQNDMDQIVLRDPRDIKPRKS
jgi:CelD/BcsL family acetyltransferase involved in cellulose biosynthesis